MTVEQFRQLPEEGPSYYELRHGEPVPVTRPKLKHYYIQQLLLEMLKTAAGKDGFAGTEFAFRALPEYELRIADVAYVSQQRWVGIDLEGDFMGAPDLVIEV